MKRFKDAWAVVIVGSFTQSLPQVAEFNLSTDRVFQLKSQMTKDEFISMLFIFRT